MEQINAVFEVDGSDVATFVYAKGTEACSTLYKTYLVGKAKTLASEHNVPLSDVSIRFVEVTE